jgi:hypothetical protein
MSLPVGFPHSPRTRAAAWKDVTPLNCGRQFKPFVYLNLATGLSIRAKGRPRLCGRGFRLNVNPQLAALIRHLALTSRILLLLAGLLAAALLLAGLLTRVLVLLTRILVRIAHSGTPFWISTADNRPRQRWLREQRQFLCDHSTARV